MTNFNGEHLNRIEALAMSNAKAIEALTQSVNTVAEASGRTLRAFDGLREIVEEDRINFQEYRDRNDSTIAELRANLAILQQLVRERNGNPPPQA